MKISIELMHKNKKRLFFETLYGNLIAIIEDWILPKDA